MEQDTDEVAYRSVIDLAVDLINLDPILLPGVNLVVELADVSRLRALRNVGGGANDAAYLRIVEASHLVEQLRRADVVATVGAGYSSDVMVLAPPMFAAGIPLISQSATKSTLSNKTQYPGFARMSTPDDIQTVALAATIDRFNWQRIVAVNCDDPFCRGYLEDLRRNLAVSTPARMCQQPSICPCSKTSSEF